MKGEPYGRFFTITPQYLTLADPNRTTPLVQGNMQIIAEKAGTYYLPAINLINIRVQKEFVIKDTQRIQLMFNMFNFADAKTVTAVNQLTGQSFNQPIGQPRRNRRPLQHALHLLTMRTRLRSVSFGGQAVCTTVVLLLSSAHSCALNSRSTSC